MNEKPTVEVNKLQPITKFIYTLGVLPTSYLMSMTYQEQLTWLCNYLSQTVIPAINDDVEAVQELQQLYIDLENYVNNYFDNLDVQEEINNKLSQMASDGSLYDIIRQYTDPIINEQNQRITNVEEAVQNVANGSPFVATSTSEMTDTDHIYVNTTDGKWYYYNGEEWTIGGDYQTTGIADGSIDLLMLNNALQSNFNMDFGENITSQTIDSVYYDDNNGQIRSTSATNYASYVVDLDLGATYLYSGFNIYQNCGMLITNSDGEIVYKTPITDTSGYEGISYLFNVKTTGLKAYINRRSETQSNNVKDYYNVTLCKVNRVNNNLNLKTTVSVIRTITGAYVDGSTSSVNTYPKFAELNNYSTKYYRISKGLNYNITSANLYAIPGIIITDNSYKILYNTYTSYADTKVDVTYSFKAEKDGYAILPYREDRLEHTIEISYDGINIDNKLNTLSNKIVLWNGDSICEGGGNDYVSYVNFITTKFDLTSTNYAVSGRCVADEDGETSILDTIPTMSSTADYVIFEGGWNDMYRVPLGTISSGYDAELDTTTWSGALESLIKQSKNKWLTAKIGFILPHGRADAMRTTQNQYWDRAIEIFNKWNLPYLDLRHNGLIPLNNTIKDLFFITNAETGHGDGTHPNNLGYETFYNNPIAQWMNRL